ncbi:hypothetical protein [Neptunicella marina]|uniref:Uncharacterized protein n=1 Tax=Neptunicella marina TaxID=2125989 RepID=A0A8J6IPT4_9ALTE|nr:hypothetical protein [Neptunicella marina]MBC3764479.1 hypothetical protein [Neptunicella marina]
MAGSKRLLETYEKERQHKEEQLLELPAMLVNAHEEIGVLRAELKHANSFKSKLPDYLIGGLIGAIIGFTLTYLFG